MAKASLELYTRRVGRNALWWLSDGPGGHGDEPATVDDVEASLAGRFRFVAEGDGNAGLRAPQLGALHAILAAQSVGSTEPVTVVLPTGTGKTETMLAAYCHQPRRTLVVVPSDSLRTQIGQKFATLGVLPAMGAIEGEYLAPTVGVLKSRPKSADQARELMDQAGVIVATASVLSRCNPETREVLVDATRQLFIDEARHVAARTWREIADAFSGRPIVQFTATPFREDGHVVDGRVAYAYPLRLAQENGWFARINYRSIPCTCRACLAGELKRPAAAPTRRASVRKSSGINSVIAGRRPLVDFHGSAGNFVIQYDTGDSSVGAQARDRRRRYPACREIRTRHRR